MKFVTLEKSSAVAAKLHVNPLMVRTVTEQETDGVCILHFAPSDSVKVKGTLSKVMVALEKGLTHS